MKMLKEAIEYFKNLFKKDKYEFIKKEKINYNYIKTIDVNIGFILPDIILYNKHLKKLLENDIFNDFEYRHIKAITANTLVYKNLLWWCSDNGKVLNNLDKEIKQFFLLTDELIFEFNRLKKFKGNNPDYKFNIRQLQPYIINIETIRGCFK